MRAILSSKKEYIIVTGVVDDTFFDDAVDHSKNSLVEGIIKELPEASINEGDEADGATIAALHDFTSCNNNTSSLAPNRKTTSTNGFGELEDAVMARLQVLKRGEGNNSSIVNGGQEVFHSDDWVCCFEIKQPGRGAREELIQKTDLPDAVED